MVQTVIDCINDGVPGIGEYMESRFIKLPTLPKAIQKELQSSVRAKIDDTEYGVLSATPWVESIELVGKMYESEDWNQRYNNFIFDIPFVHGRFLTGKRFIEALETTDDIKIFGFKSTQVIVNKHWANR